MFPEFSFNALQRAYVVFFKLWEKKESWERKREIGILVTSNMFLKNICQNSDEKIWQMEYHIHHWTAFLWVQYSAYLMSAQYLVLESTSPPLFNECWAM